MEYKDRDCDVSFILRSIDLSSTYSDWADEVMEFNELYRVILKINPKDLKN